MDWKITAIGAVVSDIQGTMKKLWDLFGMGPWKIRKFSEDGRDLFLSAIFQSEKLEIELVQPSDQEGVYASFLRDRGEGLHHICITPDQEDGTEILIKDLEKKGIRKLMDLKTGENGRRVSMDTFDQLHFALEIRSGREKPEAFGYYPGKDAVPDFKSRQYIRQMGIIVADVDETIKNFEYYLGIGDWVTVPFNNSNMDRFYIEGQPEGVEFEFICSVRWKGEVEFELVQPVKGPLIYFDYLRRKGEGFNHYKTVMSDDEIQKLTEHMEPFGIHDVQSGDRAGNRHYNLNTESSVGFTIELGNGGKSIAQS